MRVTVKETAVADLDGIYDWISQDSPRAAAEMVRRISARINLLAVSGFSHIGRLGQVAGTRELVEAPYLIVYEIDEVASEITIVSIVHGARNRAADD